MARCSQLLFVALFLFASLQIGESLKCYECTGTPGQECDNPAKNQNFVKECQNGTDVVCYFRNTTLTSGATEIVRNCAVKSDCPTTKGVDIKTQCSICETDLCNSSSYIMPSMVIINIVAVIFAKIYL